MRRVYRFDIRGRYQGSLMIETFYFEDYSNTSIEDAIELLYGTFRLGWLLTVRSVQVTTMRWLTVKLYEIHPDPLKRVSAVKVIPDAEQAGSIVGDGLPSSQAAVVLRGFALGQRRFNGRTFVPGLPTTEAPAGQLDPLGATYGSLLAAANLLKVGVSIPTGGPVPVFLFEPVVVRRRQPYNQDGGYNCRSIRTVGVQTAIRTIRSRQQGVGA